MKRDKSNVEYTEWIPPDVLHQATLHWLSELQFTKDEQLFLNSLVQSYTLQFLGKALFDRSRTIISGLSVMESGIDTLIAKIEQHGNDLEIMVDAIDQIQEEKNYLATHRDMEAEVHAYMHDYRDIKQRLFSLVSEVMKKEKQGRLLS